jgi:phosphoglycolate phosphatase-like HAD superfamily hydrolase
MIRAIVFDFDGVLVDSNDVKQSAYFRIFEHLGPGTAAIIRDCLTASPDGNRFQKIRLILDCLREHGSFAETEEPDRCIGRYAEAYSEICEEHAATCAEVGGASAVLPVLFRQYPLHVNSATWEEALRRVVRRRGWEHFFQTVAGSPTSKVENLRAILERGNLSAADVLMVGDGRRDLEAAKVCGCPFVGVRNPHNDFDPMGLTMIDTLHELATLLCGDERRGDGNGV